MIVHRDGVLGEREFDPFGVAERILALQVTAEDLNYILLNTCLRGPQAIGLAELQCADASPKRLNFFIQLCLLLG